MFTKKEDLNAECYKNFVRPAQMFIYAVFNSCIGTVSDQDHVYSLLTSREKKLAKRALESGSGRVDFRELPVHIDLKHTFIAFERAKKLYEKVPKSSGDSRTRCLDFIMQDVQEHEQYKKLRFEYCKE